MDISRFINFQKKWLLVIDVILLSLSGAILLWTGDILQEYLSSRFSYIIASPEPIRVVAFFIYLVLFFMLIKTLFIWIFNLSKRNKIYKFRSQDWPNEWIFNGKTEPNNVSDLYVKSSRAGCLLNDYHWKNFMMTFEMKFDSNDVRPLKNIGLVFRAEDLDNYFMLEIVQENPFYGNKTISGLKPHVRYKGGWDGMSIEEKSFDFSDFVKVSMEVKDNMVHFYLKDELIFDWILPTHVDVNHREAGVEEKDEERKEGTGKKTVAGHVQEIPFRLNYGKVGFRAHMLQGAIIRGLEIKPL